MEDLVELYLCLKDLPKRVLVSSFRVTSSGKEGWSPVFFSNFPGSPTSEETVLDVALSSSAAPVYFPSHNGRIDGGMVANNPSTAAVCAAVDRNLGGQALERVYLLSVGTGSWQISIKDDTTRWGAFEWMFYPDPMLPLLSILFNGSVSADELYTSQLLTSRYYRLNTTLPRNISLDDYQKIPALMQLAQNYNIGPAAGWAKSNWF
ncbi:patatin-like phospholipase family protein [Desulfotruncus arcticus]|uniref:patatin-like phospholipase family protein n=1 Tax=Desulfotruncus arcticus TaxID=341036 RepID=UPI00307F1814